jgi:hypothetical protein
MRAGATQGQKPFPQAPRARCYVPEGWLGMKPVVMVGVDHAAPEEAAAEGNEGRGQGPEGRSQKPQMQPSGLALG